MPAPDDLELLLADVRKTIHDNSQFLKKLGDEAVEDEEDGEADSTVDDDYEEL